MMRRMTDLLPYCPDTFVSLRELWPAVSRRISCLGHLMRSSLSPALMLCPSGKVLPSSFVIVGDTLSLDSAKLPYSMMEFQSKGPMS